eukprot:COSAG01_NODE_339_length_18653_cov_21.648378_13_plen_69_part_00
MSFRGIPMAVEVPEIRTQGKVCDFLVVCTRADCAQHAIFKRFSEFYDFQQALVKAAPALKVRARVRGR